MNHFLNLFTSECRKFFTEPKRLFYVLVLPFLLFGFFASLFSAGVARKMPMGYIDRDQSQTSQSLVRMLGSTPSMDLCYSLRDEEEAKRLIQQQKIMGFVSIPHDRRDVRRRLCDEKAIAKRRTDRPCASRGTARISR